MNSRELRELSLEELSDKHKMFKEELFNLRFQHAIGQLSNTGRIGDVKRSIARVLTVMREKEIGPGRPA
ncbi:MAG TPA: 50S ribosomal protein L29 [Synergistales bacterium]|jgi:large subunit ribosomal protein L29|nr:50S ribosomal protein L29 [Synergistales bacterium]HRV70976.1 50S ribosomal protein L29 [Thermovirgaceae bacterium]